MRHIVMLSRGLIALAVLALATAWLFLSDSLISGYPLSNEAAAAEITWEHLSSATGDLPAPSGSTEQVVALILDVDEDEVNDFVIGSRRSPGPSLVWFRRGSAGWTRYVIEPDVLPLEAGGAFHDIDGDGDLDIVAGAGNQDNQVWWWENPYPNFSPNTNWTRRLIKDGGANKHHDMMFGDFDGDSNAEFVYWNQGASNLFMVDIPANPRTTQPWPGMAAIYTAPDNKSEGLTQADVDGDGKIDIIGGGYWLKHTGGTNFTPNLIQRSPYLRVAAGQLIPGGRPEIVQIPGDADGPARWFEWNGSSWIGRDLPVSTIKHGHSLAIADVNGDGRLDIFIGEMRFAANNANSNPNARTLLLMGNSQGSFTLEQVATGFGHHESRLGDLDGDDDIDILGKPYTWDTPRLDIWLNDGEGSVEPPDDDCDDIEDRWRMRVIDPSRPRRAVFIDWADLNGDGREDIVTGAWWYRNPGAADGAWARAVIGAGLDQVAAVYDFDGDGDRDILGTTHSGGQEQLGNEFVWARNNGAGQFTLLDNIDAGDGDFLQGVAVGRFGSGLQVMLSWHREGAGVERLIVPANPSTQRWTIDSIAATSLGEELSAADIDRDSDLDLLLGTKWLENRGASWAQQTLFSTSAPPDRNRLVDIDDDGRLDAVIGYEAISAPAKLAWYKAPANPTGIWTEKLIDTIIGPMSLDVGDVDGDGDPDVVAGEHNTNNPQNGRVFIYENVDGAFTRHLIATGHEHHDGTQFVDIDNDGDLDIISIGWTHAKVLLYEQVGCGAPQPTRTPTPPSGTPTPTPVASATPTSTPTAGAALYYVSSITGGTVGGVRFADEDILRFDAGVWSLYFDGSDVGLGARDVDAFHLLGDGSLLLSLNAAQSLPGVGAVDDSDVLRFTPTSLGGTTAGSFVIYFDGSDVGLTADTEDVDAIAMDPLGNLLLSTTGKATAGAVRAQGEDVLSFRKTALGETTAGSWSLYFDGTAAGLTAASEKLDGVWMGADNTLYLSTLGDFQLDGASGRAHDVFGCALAAGGKTCASPAALHWQGGLYGFGSEVIDALHLIEG